MTKDQANIIANRIASNAMARLFRDEPKQREADQLVQYSVGRSGSELTRNAVFELIYAEASTALTDAARVIDAAQNVRLAAIHKDNGTYQVGGCAFEELRDSLEAIGVPTFQPKQVEEFKKGEKRHDASNDQD